MDTHHLRITPRASQLTITADPTLERQVRVSSEGAEPLVRERTDSVEIEYTFAGRVRAASTRRGSLTVALNPAYAWSIELRGGVSGLRAELGDVAIGEIAISGGASDIAIDLPAPHGELPLRIEGGVSHATIRRPGDTPVVLEIDGGASGLTLDDTELGSIGGRIRQRTPGGADGAGAVAIRVSGGASGLAVEAS